VCWFPGLDRPPDLGPDQPTLLDPPRSTTDSPQLTGPPLPADPLRPFEGSAAARERQGWQATPDSRLPDPVAWSAGLALAAVEAARRRRPLGQLSRWLVDDEYDRLAALVDAPSARSDERLHPRPEPLNARVQSAHVQCPHPEVAEAAVHVRIGASSVAVAIRLEASYDRWLATVLRLVSNGGPRRASASPRSRVEPVAAPAR